MPRLPVNKLGALTKEYGMTHSVLLTWSHDKEIQHIVTYGTTQENCASASSLGNKLKKALRWPESTQDDPTPMKKLRKENEELKARNAKLASALRRVYKDNPA